MAYGYGTSFWQRYLIWASLVVSLSGWTRATRVRGSSSMIVNNHIDLLWMNNTFLRVPSQISTCTPLQSSTISFVRKVRGGSIDTTNATSNVATSFNQALPHTATSSPATTTTTTPSAAQTIYKISTSSLKGKRNYMEDEYYISSNGDYASVFDGHGGQSISKYLRQNLYANIQATLPSILQNKKRKRLSKGQSIKINDDEKSEEERDEDDGDPTSSSTSNKRTLTLEDYEQALIQALNKVDNEVKKISHWSFQGSTAVVVWIHEERTASLPKQRIAESINKEDKDDDDEGDSGEKNASDITIGKSGFDSNGIVDDGRNGNSYYHRTIIAANVGDSRAVLCRAGAAVDLTRDHKPNDPLERARIEGLGGTVEWCGSRNAKSEPILGSGVYRVNGNLALSRAIGDRSEKPFVSNEPELSRHYTDEASQLDEFIVIASDGLWDVMSSQDVISFIRSNLFSNVNDDDDKEYNEESTKDTNNHADINGDGSRDVKEDEPSQTTIPDTIRKKEERGRDEKISKLMSDMASLVTAEALRRGTLDNITVIIIWLMNEKDITRI